MSIKKHIPNCITCCNLISGCIATYYAIYSLYDYALLFIIIGAVFDFFDGMSARLLNVSSPIGKELDSLADDITFGLAPSTIVFSFLMEQNWTGIMQETAWHSCSRSCHSSWRPFLPSDSPSSISMSVRP